MSIGTPAISSSASISGSPLPISGASTGVGVAILDSSGNQITSFGGGTQYTDAGTPPTHPVGPTIEWNNTQTNTWSTVSDANPLPIQFESSQGLYLIDNTGNSLTLTPNPNNVGFNILTTSITDGSGEKITSTGNALDINIKSGNITGFATESGGNLAAIKTDVDKIPSQGQALAAASMPVVLTAAQVSTLTPPAAIIGFATSAKQDTGNTSVASIDTKTPALGQALAAASVPVVMTASQLSTLTPPAAITGFALETGGNLATIAGAVSSSKMAVKAADGDITSFGSLTTAKSTATDTTSVGVIPLLKEISYMEQNPASRAVTGTFYQTTQPVSIASAQVASGAIASGAIASGAVASGAIASGAAVSGAFADGSLVTLGAKADAKSTATDTTAVTIMQVLKEISAMEQAPASRAVTNSGTFAVQAAQSTATNLLTASYQYDSQGNAIATNAVSGVASATGTSDTAVIAAQGASKFIYITGISVVNTGAAASLVTIETDTASTKIAIFYMIAPAGGGQSISFPTPLKTSASNKNVGFVCGTASTTIYCSISGYYGV